MSSDIAAIVTLHREAYLAVPTLRSLQRAANHARANGLGVDFVLVLDRADSDTSRLAYEFAQEEAATTVLAVDVGDLSSARNHGIAHTDADCIAVHDGDDLWSTNWLLASHERLQEAGPQTILHPELTMPFGAWNAYLWQVDQSDAAHFRPHALLTVNLWNACSFAHRRAFVEHPYQVSRVGEAGFGYEDWHWNCETIAAGYVHRPAPRTVRFERRKASGSLNLAHQAARATIRPSRFFETLE